MLKRATSVVRRVNIDALDLPRERLFERFEREEVVAEDKAVIEQVVIGHPMRSMVRLLQVFQQDSRLNPGRFSFPIQVSSNLCFRSIRVLKCFIRDLRKSLIRMGR